MAMSTHQDTRRAALREAFERFIGRHGPAYVERLKLSPAEAARAIRDSGGVPVLAHPFTFDLNGTLLKSVHPEQLVPELVKAGLGGIETYYHRYPGDAIVSLLRLAEKFGLSAGMFPVCEYVSARTLALPFFGGMTSVQVDRVCKTLDRILEKTLTARKGRF